MTTKTEIALTPNTETGRMDRPAQMDRATPSRNYAKDLLGFPHYEESAAKLHALDMLDVEVRR